MPTSFRHRRQIFSATLSRRSNRIHAAISRSDPLEPSALPTMLRPENPRFLAAWKALYGYKYDDMNPQHVRELMEAKKQVMSQQGDHFLIWVLDQLGIESELANRIAMGRGLEVPRFRWVPFDDPL